MKTAIVETPSGLSEHSLPLAFSESDQASQLAQRAYLRLVRSDIALILLAAAVGSYAPQDANKQSSIALTSGVLFVVSLLLSGIIATKRFETLWYAGRAVAESVKTLTWRFAMRAEPFDADDASAERRFLTDLKLILDERRHFAADLIISPDALRPQISEAMKRVRALSLTERREAYLRDRIKDQEAWYRSKASSSRRSQARWFAIIVIAQMCASVAAFLLMRYPAFPVNGTGVFAAVAAAAGAWMQVKRHQELTQSYAVAAYELAVIREHALQANTDGALSVFVGDAENAISREHTLWLARRDA